ncbi:RDD family protein [Stutzerimonas urumqiensis]|uniref:RDD family protein n=1 Tax=Stutzerimonas urumqiensis TaxID=638269 RepID=UPI003DA40DD8
MSAPNTPAYPLDNLHRVETPEGIDLNLHPAGLVPRALAFAIDLAIRAVLLIALGTLLAMLGGFGIGLGAMLLFAVQWTYMVVFEVFNQGRTPGKQWLGLQVIHDDGTPVGWASSLTRNLLRFVDLLPFGYFFGVICCLWHPSFKRLGDLAAGTLVIHRQPAPASVQLPAGPERPPARPLGLDDQRTLVAFAERAPSLSPERRRELAEILAPRFGVAPEAMESHLMDMARYLVGRS